MNPFSGPDGRRSIIAEIREAIAERVDCTPVYGFSELVVTGDAVVGGERYSGYAEMHDRREWLLPLSSKHGVVWTTQDVPAERRGKVAFFLNIGFGNGSPLPQPSGQFDVHVNGHKAVSIRVVNHSQLWREGDCSLAFAANRLEASEPYGSLCLSSIIKDEAFASFGPALLVVPSSWVESGKPATIKVEAQCEVDSTRWFQLAPTANLMQSSDIHRAADLLDPAKAPKSGDHQVYFGDIHTHSGEVDAGEGKGCGMGTREANYGYARGPGGLDFYALTDHEYQIDPDRVDAYLGLADQHNEDGRFVCLPAFEHTNALFGHRNVYFRGPGGTVVNANKKGGGPTFEPSQCVSPEELWKALEATGTPFITVPHHPSATSHPMNLEIYNHEYDRLFEIYSCWGSSEYYGDFPRGVSDRFRSGGFQAAMRRGLRYGVIGSADGHDGHPGNAQSPLVKHHHIFHFCGSGRAAVLAKELTREAVFDALHERRCYATTGTPIVLSFNVNNAIMGSELPALPSGRKPRLTVRCQGTNGIDHIRIVKNGEVIRTLPGHGAHGCSVEFEDTTYSSEEPSAYYVRVVQVDRESAWSSPVWVGYQTPMSSLQAISTSQVGQR